MSKFIEPSLVNEILMGFDIGVNGGLVYNDFDRLVIEPMRDDLQWLYGHVRYCQKVTAENVHAMPGQGIVSTGKLLEAKGILKGLCAAADNELTLIEPLKWIECYTLKRRKHFKDKPDWKKHLLSLARELAPSRHVDRITIKTCDAYLMWNWVAAKNVGVELSNTKQLTFI